MMGPKAPFLSPVAYFQRSHVSKLLFISYEDFLAVVTVLYMTAVKKLDIAQCFVATTESYM
jgi:hypothetical protein